MSREYHLGCIRDAIRIFNDSYRENIKADAPLDVMRAGYYATVGVANATMSVISMHLDALEAEEPRFANVFCSQCGQDFGPGDSGYSHCVDHAEEKGVFAAMTVNDTEVLDNE